MQFIYPASRQFPFDETCGQIVRALHARAFQVPGFTVTFRDYGSGEQKLRHVGSIVSDQSAIDLGHHDVKIRFGRPQGLLPGGRWNNCAAVDEVRYRSRSLHVYDDESGPTFNVYVGECWETDRSVYWDRYNAKLDGLPRKCLRYSGRSGYRNARAARLVAEPDHREYAPMGDEPVSYDTAEVMAEVRAYLQDVVLPAIEAYPIADVVADVCAEPPPIPFPSGIGPFFTYGEGRDVRRIELGKKCLDELQLADRYGMNGSGWRLAPIGIKSGDDLPEVAYDGFLWCGTTPNVPGEHGRGSADQLVKVTPKNARGIYVADHAVYEKRRAALSEAIKDQRDRFTDAEVNDFIRARACTIIPILDYKGDYEAPIYLINRELGFDEVEVIGRRPE
jgi:hypothetical protein